MKLGELGEFRFIQRMAAGRVLKPGHILLDIGDDAAGWRTAPGQGNLLTTDMLVEGTHFRLRDFSPEQLGHKSLAVNLSDIAAVGGRPLDAYLSLGIPPERIDVEFMDGFYRGFYSLSAKWDVSLLGGDTARSPVLVISVALTGTADPEKLIKRSGAKGGDRIFLTGPVGDAAAGFDLLLKGTHLSEPFAAGLIKAHREPEPHLQAASVLADSKLASAMIDLSDGLIQDLGQVCGASSVGAVIFEDDLPISGALRSYASRTGWRLPDEALKGGEDYCLLFTASPSSVALLRRLFADEDLELYEIGRITDGPEIEIHGDSGRKTVSPDSGWDHFRTLKS